jgi:hypothetical protein
MAVPSELTVFKAPQHDRPAPAVSTQLTAAPRPLLFSLIGPEENSEGTGVHGGNPRFLATRPLNNSE